MFALGFTAIDAVMVMFSGVFQFSFSMALYGVVARSAKRMEAVANRSKVKTLLYIWQHPRIF